MFSNLHFVGAHWSCMLVFDRCIVSTFVLFTTAIVLKRHTVFIYHQALQIRNKDLVFNFNKIVTFQLDAFI